MPILYPDHGANKVDGRGTSDKAMPVLAIILMQQDLDVRFTGRQRVLDRRAQESPPESGLVISNAMQIARSGMTAQTARLGAIASNVANAETPGYRSLHVEQSALDGGGTVAVVRPMLSTGVDMTDQITGLVEAEIGFKANAAVFETASDMMRDLYDLGED